MELMVDEEQRQKQNSILEMINRMHLTLHLISDPYPGLNDKQFKVWAIQEAKRVLEHYENVRKQQEGVQNDTDEN